MAVVGIDACSSISMANPRSQTVPGFDRMAAL
jgi:hypothetical protein